MTDAQWHAVMDTNVSSAFPAGVSSAARVKATRPVPNATPAVSTGMNSAPRSVGFSLTRTTSRRMEPSSAGRTTSSTTTGR